MFRTMIQACALVAVAVLPLGGCRDEAPRREAPPGAVSQQQVRRGEELFKRYCAACHPDGGNVSDPERTLRGDVLRSRRIARPQDIVRIMRTPLSRMIAFDPATIPDEDARAIAEYVLYAFR
ncbi:c-type cytochrome [Geobacter sp. FeAm09]|uniref:c-type cytochrome n=1 Tax=Geobacter sp. FeAm09 TaxID=2597769 RepID=UPI0011ED173D|nr:c-type cytochrome [Geobacter sp. FeAm09]QEM69291.1 c-type cytochrome [Geobacter sp. FeAm09]